MTPSPRERALARIHVCIPYRRLVTEFMGLVEKYRLRVEVGIDAMALDGFSLSEFRETAQRLAGQDLPVSLHAPFWDLSPGAVDPMILKPTRERLRQFAGVARLFDPRAVVLHTGWDRRHHGEPEEWLTRAAETFGPLVEMLNKTTRADVAFENVYERTPRMIRDLLSRLPRKRTGFCLDTGHMLAFSETPLSGWLDVLGHRLKEIHLHDNDGTDDDHLPPGQGKVDFPALFTYLKDQGRDPVLTLEARSEAAVWEGAEYLSKFV